MMLEEIDRLRVQVAVTFEQSSFRPTF